MTIDIFTGGAVSTNSYLLQNGETTLLIDAPQGVDDWLAKKEITPDYLLLTHQHFDHVEDAHLFACPILAFCEFARDLIMDQEARAWGLPVHVAEFTVAKTLADQKNIQLGAIEINVLHVPGHSPDSLVFHLPSSNAAIVGDTLFNGGVGRTDLPGGDEQLLFQGIREKLLTLPSETQIFPGHGPQTTPRQEQGNPFLS